MSNIIEYRCPNCDTVISEKAITCPACGFQVEDYRDNHKNVKYVLMEKALSDYDTIKHEVIRIAIKQKSTRSSVGCLTGLALIVSGFFITFVPVVGWIAGPIMIIAGLLSGFVLGIAPSEVLVFFGKLFNTDTYRKDVAQAQRNIANKYIKVPCPFCQTTYDNLIFSNHVGGFFDCQKCHNRLIRQKDYLFYIPKPKAVLNNDPIKDFVR